MDLKFIFASACAGLPVLLTPFNASAQCFGGCSGNVRFTVPLATTPDFQGNTDAYQRTWTPQISAKETIMLEHTPTPPSIKDQPVKPALTSNAIRSWTNGDGQWLSSPNGTPCQAYSTRGTGTTGCSNNF